MAAGGEEGRKASAQSCRVFPGQLLQRALAALKDASSPPELRVECLWALGQLGDPSGAAALKDNLASADAKVREVSAYGLGRLKEVSAADALLKLVEDDQPMTAAAAAWSLWRIGQPRTAGQLVSLLDARLSRYKEGDQQVVRMLLLGVGTFKCADAVSIIERHMSDKSQAANVNMAMAALGSIGGERAVAAASALYDTHGRAAESSTFCRALAVAGAPGAGELVRRVAGRSARETMDATLILATAPGAVKTLAPLVAEGKLSPEARQRVVSILLLHADPAAKALLKALAGDQDPTVANLARWALTGKG